ncbi:N-acetyltransferase [Amylibacter sp.]|nr:N-acetyltransferase [Amylibacter sp.]
MSELEIKTVSITDTVVLGRGVTVYQPSNLYDCEIGDQSFVGPFVEVQRGVRIGSNTKIQSHSFICELVTIGDNCFIGHAVVFINDTFTEGGPSMGDKTKWLPTVLGDKISIGSNSTILPVKICDDVVIAAGSVVTRDITKPGVYGGNPARFMRQI